MFQFTLAMGQKQTKSRKVYPDSGRNVSRSGDWGQTIRHEDHFRQSLAEVVAEFGLKVPYEPSHTIQYQYHPTFCSQRSENISSAESDEQEMTSLFPEELRRGSKTFCNVMREKICRLHRSLQHVTFQREQHRRDPRLAASHSQHRTRSREHLQLLQVLLLAKY